jgi:hypothetical protein
MFACWFVCYLFIPFFSSLFPRLFVLFVLFVCYYLFPFFPPFFPAAHLFDVAVWQGVYSKIRSTRKLVSADRHRRDEIQGFFKDGLPMQAGQEGMGCRSLVEGYYVGDLVKANPVREWNIEIQ